MRSVAPKLLVFVGLLASATAAAQGLDAERFSPAAGAAGGLVVERAAVPRHLGLGLGLFVNYADDALVVKDSRTTLARVVDDALSLNLLGSIGLFGRAEFAVDLPLRLLYRGEAVEVGGARLAARAGIGDLRLVPKVVVWRSASNPMLVLGFALPMTLPTGDKMELRGSGAFGIEPRLLVSLLMRRVALHGNLGFRVKAGLDPPDPVGHELTFGLGMAVALYPHRHLLDLLAEIGGAWDVSRRDRASTDLSLEALAGLVVRPHPAIALYVGGGAGIVDGLGTPDFRVLGGIRYESRPVANYRDGDNDGISDQWDRCPTQPETFNGYHDYDGCPEEDRDHDGVPDDIDECPDVPEGPDGDGDGCPKGRVIVDRGRIILIGKVQFETGSAVLRRKSEPLLDTIAHVLRDHPEIKRVEIQGHTDWIGGAQFNQHLSEQRAATVKAALHRRGVPERRLVARGYGESRPRASNHTAAGRAMNRRVELVVME